MPKGISLHVGLNSVDPARYAGWSGPLNACEADARDMKLIAEARGFDASILLTADATRDAVKDGIAAAAAALGPDDIFLLTISSHGGQVPDLNGDEPEALDETWCLFDGEIIDDEVSYALADFQAGVRVVVVSDSCHSGSAVRSPAMRLLHGDLLSIQAKVAQLVADKGSSAADVVRSVAEHLPRVMPRDLIGRVYLENKDFYDAIGARPELNEAKNNIAASVILLSGCQDSQLSMDGPFNGAFTGALKRVWNAGNHKGGYDRFVADINDALGDPTQTPGVFRVGAANAEFDAQQPFLIG